MKSVDVLPAVLLHGFAQNRDCWGPLADRLAKDRPLTAVDLPGHGASAAVHTDLWGAGRYVLDAASPGPCALIGYSLGGRVALHAALTAPERVAKLVLISTTAGLEDATERAKRRAADEKLADHIEAVGIDAFVDEWLQNPLFAGLTDETRFVAERRKNDPAGLASSLRLAGTGTQEPLWDRLGELTMPTLVIAGENDPRYEVYAERLASSIGDHSMLVVVGGSTHSPHLEKHEAVVELIAAWLSN
ncbi:MAG: alpha/beta fold hydrolase [Actinobacteria bacterium]|nr:alpha/beta fold hydrolase [Actinomycetota bacterium]